MKTFFIWLIVGLTVSMNLTAQRGGGRGGGGASRGGGGGGGNFSEMRGPQPTARDYDNVSIAEFPEIAGLETKQTLNLFKIVKDEQKNILKLMDQKQDLQTAIDRSTKQKDIDSNKKKIANLDEKIKKESLNADKKIRSTLKGDQYADFIGKKDQIKFSIPPVQRGGR